MKRVKLSCALVIDTASGSRYTTLVVATPENEFKRAVRQLSADCNTVLFSSCTGPANMT